MFPFSRILFLLLLSLDRIIRSWCFVNGLHLFPALFCFYSFVCSLISLVHLKLFICFSWFLYSLSWVHILWCSIFHCFSIVFTSLIGMKPFYLTSFFLLLFLFAHSHTRRYFYVCNAKCCRLSWGSESNITMQSVVFYEIEKYCNN